MMEKSYNSGMAKRKLQRGGRREGAGRPTILKNAVNKSVRFPKATFVGVQKYAKRHSLSESQAVVQLTNSGLAQWDGRTIHVEDEAKQRVTCQQCGHAWISRARKPRCSKCKSTITRVTM